jgi:hypothetical protein
VGGQGKCEQTGVSEFAAREASGVCWEVVMCGTVRFVVP